MSGYRAPKSLLFVVAATLLAVGAGIGAFATNVGPPDAIAPTPRAQTAPATAMTTVDSQDASLAVSKASVPPLAAGADGIVTSTKCAHGRKVASGSSILSVNGKALILFASAQPLWRNLSPGAHGDDVTAVQRELTRLGFRTPIDGRFDRTTLRAAIALATRAGAKDAPTWSMVPVSRVVWMPSPTVTVVDCPAHTGSRLASGAPVATLPDQIQSAKVAPMPADLMPGRREVVIDDLSLAVDSAGAITHRSDLSRLGASDAYSAFTRSPSALDEPGGLTADGSHSPTMAVTLQLVKPIAVFSVPAAAVYAVHGTSACVIDDRVPRAVRIVGSQLGQTFVVPERTQTLSRVTLVTAGARRCR